MEADRTAAELDAAVANNAILEGELGAARGMAVQIDRMKPKLKPPATERLKQKRW